MTKVNSLILLLSTIIFGACASAQKTSENQLKYELSETEKSLLIAETDKMMELDQKYRSILSLGTMNPEIIQKNATLSESASFEEYMAFLKTVTKDLTPHQTDSLWKLQQTLDSLNYIQFKSIVNKFGYPSAERLGIKDVSLFIILLHPPVHLNPKDYMDEMQQLLLKEVFEKRMEAKQYAMLVDDIKVKILREPQIYGTVDVFDTKTMQMGLPMITNLKHTNKKRKQIGLEPLKQGEFILSK